MRQPTTRSWNVISTSVKTCMPTPFSRVVSERQGRCLEETIDSVNRYNHVSRYCWSHAKGDHLVGSLNDEDQDHRSTWAQILGVDRRIDPGVAVDLPTDVDFETRVRRIRPIDRPPKMLLKPDYSSFSLSLSTVLILILLFFRLSFTCHTFRLFLSDARVFIVCTFRVVLYRRFFLSFLF